MCGPAAPFVMAGLAIMGEIKSQEARMEQAQATNDAFEANQKLQNEAYTKDMEAFWNEEIAIQQQAYQNAEDAADAKIDMMIDDQARQAQLTQAVSEGTGGQSTSRSFNIIRREMANRGFDLDKHFQRGVASLKGEVKGLQRDKIQRRYSAIGQINSMQRDPGLSSGDRMMGYFSQGMQGYMAGKQFAGTPAKDPTGGGTSSFHEGFKETGRSRGSDFSRFNTRKAASYGRGWRPGG